MNNKINIIFCCNEEYAQHMMVCMVSMLKNSHNMHFHIVVVGKFYNKETLSKINNTLSYFDNCTLEIKEFDFSLMNNYPVRCHYSLDIYTRLWVQRFFSDDVEKVIYLDSDMLVVGDIANLWSIDLGNHILAAVPIPWYERTHLPNFEHQYGYFNSGVIVFNLKEWRAQQCEKKVLDFIVDNAAILRDPDQDALNDCFYKNYLPLPYEWNLIRPFYKSTMHASTLTKDQLIKIVNKEKIIHFNGPFKPWHYMDNHVKKMLYYDYLKSTAWHSYRPIDKTFINIIKKNISKILPNYIKSVIKIFIEN